MCEVRCPFWSQGRLGPRGVAVSGRSRFGGKPGALPDLGGGRVALGWEKTELLIKKERTKGVS